MREILLNGNRHLLQFKKCYNILITTRVRVAGSTMIATSISNLVCHACVQDIASKLFFSHINNYHDIPLHPTSAEGVKGLTPYLSVQSTCPWITHFDMVHMMSWFFVHWLHNIPSIIRNHLKGPGRGGSGSQDSNFKQGRIQESGFRFQLKRSHSQVKFQLYRFVGFNFQGYFLGFIFQSGSDSGFKFQLGGI